MAYEFTENAYEPEPLTSSGRTGGPPRKSTGIGVLDPPVPPKKPVGPIPGIPASVVLRILAGTLLAVMLIAIVFILFRH